MTKPETIEEMARRLAGNWADRQHLPLVARPTVAEGMEAALREMRERCAHEADEWPPDGPRIAGEIRRIGEAE